MADRAGRRLIGSAARVCAVNSRDALRIYTMNSDSDLYGDDIRLWSERQGALLRRLSAGEAVSDRVDWQHVVGEIEDLGHDYAQRAAHDEVARLTARLAAAEAEVNELRARLEDLTGKLTDTQDELATTQNQVETATARAVAAVESEQAMRQAEAKRQGRGLWSRVKAAWWGT